MSHDAGDKGTNEVYLFTSAVAVLVKPVRKHRVIPLESVIPVKLSNLYIEQHAAASSVAKGTFIVTKTLAVNYFDANFGPVTEKTRDS